MSTQQLSIWECPEQLEKIKRLCLGSSAENITDDEFAQYVAVGGRLQLDPFSKQIWCIKYSAKEPAQIFASRDGLVAVAQRNPDYETHYANAIYENDVITYTQDGGIVPPASFKNRGKLVGAYCVVYRKSSRRAAVKIVMLDGYQKPVKEEWQKAKSTWWTIPDTMIAKVAEAQGIRAAFKELSNVYIPEEKWFDDKTQTDVLKDKIGLTNVDKETGEIFEGTAENITAVEPIATQEQIEVLKKLFSEQNINEERQSKALGHFNVTKIEELNCLQIEKIIAKLNRVNHAEVEPTASVGNA